LCCCCCCFCFCWGCKLWSENIFLKQPGFCQGLLKELGLSLALVQSFQRLLLATLPISRLCWRLSQLSKMTARAQDAKFTEPAPNCGNLVFWEIQQHEIGLPKLYSNQASVANISYTCLVLVKNFLQTVLKSFCKTPFLLRSYTFWSLKVSVRLLF
jgi:hypothetical protein